MRHTSHWGRTKYLYTCVHDSATCVVGYICGWLHAWSATCVVGYMCGRLHMWLVTCVVGYMCGRLHVWSATCGQLHEWLWSPPHLACMDEEFAW